jgi:hypothetical protein
MSSASRKAATILGVLGLLCLLVLGATCGFGTVALERSDREQLLGTARAWLRAGSPQGAELALFLEGRDERLVVSNRTFVIEGREYHSQFALVDPWLRGGGTLFVTSNLTVIAQPPSAPAKVMDMK